MKTISEHLQYMLEKLNEQHPGIKRVNADESVQRVGRVIDNLNSKMSQMDVEINGQDFEKDKIPQIHNPFKKKPLVYQCLGADLAIEIFED